jgi:hypothetical protein
MYLLIFLVHLATTLVFTGIIWYAQLDQYPLLKFVGRKEVPQYEAEYYKRTMPWAVTLLIIEALSGLLLLWFRPVEVPLALLWINIFIMAIIWALTWGGCVKCHMKLECGLDNSPFHRLLNINKSRAILWTLRSLLVLWMIAFIAQ